jgi:hypothetical protein
MSEILKCVDEALITTAFVDDTAAKFWKRHWGGKVEENRVAKATKLQVPFDKFAEALYSRLGVRMPANPEESKKYQCMKAILTDPRQHAPIVTLERFSLASKWFGPLANDNFTTILEVIYNIVKCPWFHGDITKDEAISLLSCDDKKKVKSGTFLVRLCTTEPIHQNPFTITKLNSNNEIVHQRIYLRDDGTYYMPIKDKSGVTREIASNKGLVALMEEILHTKFVKAAAPRQRYKDIFIKTKPLDQGYLDNLNK